MELQVDFRVSLLVGMALRALDSMWVSTLLLLLLVGLGIGSLRLGGDDTKQQRSAPHAAHIQVMLCSAGNESHRKENA